MVSNIAYAFFFFLRFFASFFKCLSKWWRTLPPLITFLQREHHILCTKLFLPIDYFRTGCIKYICLLMGLRNRAIVVDHIVIQLALLLYRGIY